jgi:hypothetical protein
MLSELAQKRAVVWVDISIDRDGSQYGLCQSKRKQHVWLSFEHSESERHLGSPGEKRSLASRSHGVVDLDNDRLVTPKPSSPAEDRLDFC